jgi:S1-C subfamily serine protease
MSLLTLGKWKLVIATLAFVVTVGGALVFFGNSGSSDVNNTDSVPNSQGTSRDSSPSQDDSPVDMNGKWEQVARAIVFIDASGPNCSWVGSGSIVGDGSLILTNKHVAGDGECDLTIWLTDSISSTPTEYFAGEILVSDEEMDLAIIQLLDSDGLPAVAQGRQPLEFADETPDLGEKLTLLGYPGIGGSTITLTSGDFSGVDNSDSTEFFKTTANMNPGVSGGAALNADQKMVGVPTAGRGAEIACDNADECVANGSTIGLLRPIRYAKTILDRALAEIKQPTKAGKFLDTSSEEAVRNLAAHELSKLPPDSQWSGGVASCDPGDINSEYRQAILNRVKWFRLMAGVDEEISLNAEFDLLAQAAALVMMANNQLSHEPDPTWTCFSDDAFTGASNSNLYLGLTGPEAINGYIEDLGEDNYLVGHRRWILYSALTEIGIGESSKSNALFVVQGKRNDKPSVREAEGFIMWPPRGFVPRNVIFERWSITNPSADFSDTEIYVESGKESFQISSSDITVSNDLYGDGPTLIFNLDSQVRSGEAITITAKDVLVDGVNMTLNYQVKPIEL